MTRPLYIASPRGFCAGVRRALSAVERLLAEFPGEDLYVCNEIVHNTAVVEDLSRRGVRFVRDLHQVPRNALLLFSAHGVSREQEQTARSRTDRIYDASCPLVHHLQELTRSHSGRGDLVILAGRRGHPEVEGCLGRAEGEVFCIGSADQAADLPDAANRQVVLLSQTTLVREDLARIRQALERRYGSVLNAAGVCYATAHRQQAVLELTKHCKYVIILGSPHSSNSRHLKDAAANAGADAVLCENASEIPERFFQAPAAGLSAGASAPERLLEECVRVFRSRGFDAPVELRVAEENVHFPDVDTGKNAAPAL